MSGAGRTSASIGWAERDAQSPALRNVRGPTAWRLVAVAAGLAVAVATAAGSGHVGDRAAQALLEAETIAGLSAAAAWWVRRRPESRFGACLAALAAAAAVASLEASDRPAAYAVGVLGRAAFLVLAAYCLLAFPPGRLRGRVGRPAMWVLGTLTAVVAVPTALVLPSIDSGQAFGQCGRGCPSNVLQAATVRTGAVDVLHWAAGISAGVAALAIAAVLVRRLVAGSRPGRRALAVVATVGGAGAVVFAARSLAIAAGADRAVVDGLGWAYAACLALLPLAFVAPLAQAQVSAGPALEEILSRLARRPGLREWERDLRAALGDPGLRLAVWSRPEQAYVGTDGEVVGTVPGRFAWHHIDRAGTPVAAIMHDPALEADPELLQAAGAATLLSLDASNLEHEIHAARFRILAAAEEERRRLERDLHDGAQQHLIALRVKLGLILEGEPHDVRRAVAELTEDVDVTLDQFRGLAQGIYPPLLGSEGLEGALQAAARRSTIPATVGAAGLDRYPPEVESAVYFCCLEALQNAGKHAGPGARVAVRVAAADRRLWFRVEDTGRGFDTRVLSGGVGLANLGERMAAVGGQVRVASQPGDGTSVTGWVDIDEV
jgi:signal transduction histidine kinase